MAKSDTSLMLKPKLFVMKYVIFQYKKIKLSFSEKFMFLVLKWDYYQFHITGMQIYILPW